MISKREHYREKLRDEALEDVRLEHQQQTDEKPVLVRPEEQEFAACDHCDSVNNLDRYQYKGSTWCEACLEEELKKCHVCGHPTRPMQSESGPIHYCETCGNVQRDPAKGGV